MPSLSHDRGVDPKDRAHVGREVIPSGMRGEPEKLMSSALNSSFLRRFAVFALGSIALSHANAADTQARAFPLDLLPPGLDASSQFGAAIALNGAYGAVIGAPGADGGKGRAYLCTLYNGRWHVEDELKAFDGKAGDHFGAAVEYDLGKIYVGAPDHDGGMADSGAVYVYEQAVDVNGNWVIIQAAKLQGSGSTTGERFGAAIEVDGASLVIGAPNHTATQTNQGAAYIYQHGLGVFPTPTKVFATWAQAGERFGETLALEDNLLAIGSPDFDNLFPLKNNSGRVATYRRVVNGSTITWVKEPDVYATDITGAARFGSSLAIDQGTLHVGARGALNGSSVATGAVYLFTAIGTPITWIYNSKIAPGTATAGDGFGRGVGRTGISLFLAGDDRVIEMRPGFGGWVIHSELKAPFHDLVDGVVKELGPTLAVEGAQVIVGVPSDGRANAFHAFGGSWKVAGAGTSGSVGVPRLRGEGSLVAYYDLELRLRYGKPFAPALILLNGGQFSYSVPFAGGYLHSMPIHLAVSVPLDATGGFTIPAEMPAGILGASFGIQVVVSDPQAVKGASLSNGLSLTTAP